MTMFRQLLHAFGLIYDPDLDTIPGPGPDKDVHADRPVRTRTTDKTPDDVQFDRHGRRWYVRTDQTESGQVPSWTLDGQTDDVRKSEFGQVDEDMIVLRGLDEDRYRSLKPLWAAGLSAKDASAQFRGQRGYGLRTVESYWSAFNALTQLEGERVPAK